MIKKAKTFFIILLFLNKINSQDQFNNPQIINLTLQNCTVNCDPKNLQKYFSKRLPNLKKSKETISSIKSLITKNKLLFIGSAGLSIYASCLYQIFKLNKLINSQLSWSCWKPEISFDNLITINHENLIRELQSDINKKYLEQRSNFIIYHPTISFINDINNEIEQLNYYLTLHKWISKFYLSKIFNINQNSVNLVNAKIKKLEYLKTIFTKNTK